VEARRNGAQLITIDPVFTRTAKLADRHFFINPGSDLALALAMMHVIIAENLHDADYVNAHTTGFAELAETVKRYPPSVAAEFTGIPAEDIAWLARTYSTTRPAVIRTNYGISRSERGGRAMQAVAYLPVLTGSWREEGGGFTLSTGGAFAFNTQALERPDLQGPAPKRIVNMSLLGEALNDLADPPVKAFVCYNSNPAAVAPNSSAVLRGLARQDLFTVVLEQFQTDTADYADIVLPVTTFLENTDLYRSYGHYYVQLTRPAVDAPGECKSNFWIFRELARRMGFADDCFQGSEDDMIREALSSGSKFLDGITLERLEAERSIRLNVGEGPFLPHAEGGFGTASGKCEFDAAALEYTPPLESRQGDKALRARYPLELVSSKNDNSMNSTFGNRPATDAETDRAQIHTDDARARGIQNGDVVRVFNDRGSVRLKAQVGSYVGQGVIRIPSVRWPKHAPDRQGVNVLTPERLTDIGDGAVFFSCLVEAERCGD
jgi:anaerobic selenocysteine-containing dehydrogenase